VASMAGSETDPARESLGRLFLRFLRFGFLAWGGPVAQIAMIRQELVEEEKRISPERFNRVLAVYQVLPGPEATELCCYFGMLSRGRLGSIVAGLGFVLPGFVFMFILSWLYLAYGLTSPLALAAFAGVQPAVAALVVRAVHRIGGHAVHGWRLLTIAFVAAAATALGVHFLAVIVLAGLAHVAALPGRQRTAAAALLVIGAGMLIFFATRTEPPQWLFGTGARSPEVAAGADGAAAASDMARPSLLALTGSGLSAGLLTFGGAYTVIPFLQHDAVFSAHAWMTPSQFMDGLALSGVLPAPLIIFATFVGYLGGGALGALVMTIAIFAPAFSFTLIGHELLERAVENKALHALLDGVTAGVVGLIAIAAVALIKQGVTSPAAVVIFGLSLAALYRFKGKAIVPLVIGGAALAGLVLRS